MRRDFIAYPAVRAHALVGDRRSCALVAADGNVDWMCAGRFDGPPLFAALLDARRGGHFRFGPDALALGEQRYDEAPALLTTTWRLGDGELALTDAMVWSGRDEDGDDDRVGHHVLVRRLVCTRGQVRCVLSLRARSAFDHDLPLSADGEFDAPAVGASRLWSSAPIFVDGDGRARAHATLRAGESWWLVLELGACSDWTIARAEAALARTRVAWRALAGNVAYDGAFADEVRHAVMAVHMLTYGRAGSVVAAATTSLPERIGGDWNADYRLTWVRDASLSMAMLARLGDLDSAEQFMRWLCHAQSHTDMPLQVAYRPDGEGGAEQHAEKYVHGYRGSRPVRFGNHAFRQRQLDSAGFLLECAHTFARHGGRITDEYWRMLRRCVEAHTLEWRKRDHSIWELPVAQHYVSGKVMSWVALDRACRLAQLVGDEDDVDRWRAERDLIHADVLAHGWSDRMGSFRQRYEADNVDAAVLLIPLMGFLPVDDPRVRATIERVERELCIDGFVYRFVPDEVPGLSEMALGEFEAAFLPTTFWLAAVHALSGADDRARAMIERVHAMAGGPGLLAEAVDARSQAFAGNTPLLFSHVELVRAALAVDEAAARRPTGATPSYPL